MPCLFNSSRFFRMISTGLLAAALAGCSDMITYSQRSHEEGIQQMAALDYKDASGSFRSALRQEPRDYESAYYLGVCNDKLGLYSQAMESFRSSLSIMPVITTPEEAAFRMKVMDAYASAIATHDDREVELNNLEARNAAKPTADNYLVLAKTYRAKGDADSALRNYTAATRMTPKDFLAWKEFALYQLQLKQPEAEQSLCRAYALNDADPEINSGLRSLNVIPGPSLKNQDQLQKPLLPRGPIPELKINGDPYRAPSANLTQPNNLSVAPAPKE